MPGLGNKLRIKRLAMGLSPRDAAKMAGVKQKYVWALEDEEILKFPDKDTVLASVKAYSAALGLEQAELMDDFEKLWSDAGTAKIYMQQQYNRKGFLAIFSNNKALGYGAAALVAALLLSFGGYMVWGNYYSLGEPEDVFIATPEETALEEVEEAVVIEEDSNDPAVNLSADGDTEKDEETTEEIFSSAGDNTANETSGYTPMTGGYYLLLFIALISILAGFTFFFTSLIYRET